MAIPESQISVVIPTYRYREKVLRAARSALASGAGEIIIVDDASRDGTLEQLAQIPDRRLRLYENSVNLGLWENHLHAVNLAEKPWIKFLQADDCLLPDGLKAFAAAVDEGVTVVWSAPVVIDDRTNRRKLYHRIRSPRRLRAREVQDMCLLGGWVLGTPSHMMLRSDAIERDAKAWTTDISSDLVIGSIAAARGDTILLPAGHIGQGQHAAQDTNTESCERALRRIAASTAYLRRRHEPGLRRFANFWSILSAKSTFQIALLGLLAEVGPGRIVLTTAEDLWRFHVARLAADTLSHR